MKSWLIWKAPDAGKDWGQEEKGMTEDQIVGWHHRLNGHGFGWTVGVGDGQGGLVCCSSWGHKESDMTEQLNWTERYEDFPVGFVVNNLPASEGDADSIPGWNWKFMVKMKNMSFIFTLKWKELFGQPNTLVSDPERLRRKWQSAPVFLPGKSPGQRSLAGYSPCGHERVRHDLATKQQQPKIGSALRGAPPCSSDSKESACNVRDVGLIPR